MCYQSFIGDAWVHAYISVQNICTPIGRAGRANRAGGKSVLSTQKFAQDFSFKIHVILQNVLQNYASNIYRHLFESFHYPIRHRSCFHHRATFIIRYPFGKSCVFQFLLLGR